METRVLNLCLCLPSSNFWLNIMSYLLLKSWQKETQCLSNIWHPVHKGRCEMKSNNKRCSGVQIFSLHYWWVFKAGFASSILVVAKCVHCSPPSTHTAQVTKNKYVHGLISNDPDLFINLPLAHEGWQSQKMIRYITIRCTKQLLTITIVSWLGVSQISKSSIQLNFRF